MEFENEQNPNKGAWIPAAIAGVGSLFGSLINRNSARKQQERANLYNIEQWNRTNEYNSPQNQMKRYMEAGLNPNLIYGSGNASAGNAASAPEFAKISDAAYQDIPFAPALAQFADFEVKRAQTDNLKAMTTNTDQKTVTEGLVQAGKLVQNARDSFELQKAKNLEQNSYEIADAQLKQTLANTKYTLNQDERASIENDISVRESFYKIAGMKLGLEQTQLLMQEKRMDLILKKLDTEFAEMGLRPTDPFYARALLQLIERFTPQAEKLTDPARKSVPEILGNRFKDWFYQPKYKKEFPNLYPKKK